MDMSLWVYLTRGGSETGDPDVTGEIIRGTGLHCVFGELYKCGELWNKSLCVH